MKNIIISSIVLILLTSSVRAQYYKSEIFITQKKQLDSLSQVVLEESRCVSFDNPILVNSYRMRYAGSWDKHSFRENLIDNLVPIQMREEGLKHFIIANTYVCDSAGKLNAEIYYGINVYCVPEPIPEPYNYWHRFFDVWKDSKFCFSLDGSIGGLYFFVNNDESIHILDTSKKPPKILTLDEYMTTYWLEFKQRMELLKY